MADENQSVEQSEQVDPLKLFSEKLRQPVEGLIYIGHLTDTVEFCGHSFGLKTLLPQDKFAISLALQPYRNTIHEPDVYQTLFVGMALTEVDGDQKFCPPIGPNLADFAKARLNYLSKRWYPPIVEFLWNQYVLLETQAAKAVNELDFLSKQEAPMTLPSWQDYSTEQEPLNDETPSDTLPLTDSNFDS